MQHKQTTTFGYPTPTAFVLTADWVIQDRFGGSLRNLFLAPDAASYYI